LKDAFVHATALERAAMRALNEGDELRLFCRKGRGEQAGQIELA
jgi:cold shock CspA family protein